MSHRPFLSYLTVWISLLAAATLDAGEIRGRSSVSHFRSSGNWGLRSLGAAPNFGRRTVPGQSSSRQDVPNAASRAARQWLASPALTSSRSRVSPSSVATATSSSTTSAQGGAAARSNEVDDRRRQVLTQIKQRMITHLTQKPSCTSVVSTHHDAMPPQPVVSPGAVVAVEPSFEGQLVETFAEASPAVEASQPPADSDDQAERTEVPIGSPLTLTLALSEQPGTILLKSGPLVIRLTPEVWTAEGTSFTLPDFELMRDADGELYLLDDQGTLLQKYALTLTPR